MTNELMSPRIGVEALREWLVKDPDDAGADDGSQRRRADFLGLVSAEALKRHASALMGLEQVETYASRVPELPSEPNAARSILSRVLDQGISVADTETVSRVLRAQANASAQTVGEQLVAILRPQVLEVQMASESLKALTEAHVASAPQSFSFLREGLFVETGVRYPAFRFTTVDRLKPRQFAFRINHLTTLPWVGLGPGQCLANDTVERLALHNVKGTPACSPASGREQAIVGLADQQTLVEAGVTTWNEFEFVILCFAATLREHAGSFIDTGTVERDLRVLAGAFPALVDAVRTSLSPEHITSVLRSLVREGVPVRNLRAVLERLVDYGLSNGGRSDDVREMVSYVRSGIPRQIFDRHAAGTRTIVVYLLEHAIEDLVGQLAATRGSAAETIGDRIIDSIRAELDLLGGATRIPVLLTRASVRSHLHELIKGSLPALAVLAYEELPSDINVQPLGRIALSG